MVRARRMVLAAWIALAGCAGAGAHAFRAGREAERAGNLTEAIQHFEEAARADPEDASYRRALEESRAALVDRLVTEAEAQERAQDWSAAAATWARAVEVRPERSSFGVRRDLSALKAKDLDSFEWYRGVDEIRQRHPEDPIVVRSWERAKSVASDEAIAKIEASLEASDPSAAVEALERAILVDEAAVDDGLAKRARSALLVAEADERMEAKDPFGAYERYDKAYGLTPSPQISRKRRAAKRKAAPIARRLDRADALAERGRYAKALAAFEQIQKMEGAPASVAAQIADVRTKLIAAETKQAVEQAERGRLTSARRAIHRALAGAELEDAVRDEAKRAATELSSGALAEGVARLGTVPLPAADPIRVALEKLAHVAVERNVKRAGELVLRNPARALALLAGLDDYADAFPAITQLRRTLQIDAFTGTLENAHALARRGDDAGAAEMLRRALEMSDAPKMLAAPLEEAFAHLEKSAYLEADDAFRRALVVAPGSRLATWGLQITNHRRAAAADDAVKTLARGGDEAAALALLESIARVDDADAHVRDGREALLARARQESARGDDPAATALLVMAAKLTSLTPELRKTLDAAIVAFGDGEHATARDAFSTVREGAPSARVARVGQALAAQRADEEASQAERRSTQLDAIVAQANRASAAGDLRGALRALKAALATSVDAGPFKRDILTGINQITRGDPALGYEAVAKSGLAPDDPFVDATRQYAVATARRLVERARRIADRSPERAIVILHAIAPFAEDAPEIAQLSKAIEVDAFVARLDEAERHAKAGRDERAAAVLADALASSEAPDRVRTAASRGIEQLGAGQYLAAERAFADALARAPKSRLAERGRAIARDRRALAERRAREALERGRGDPGKAVETLEAALGIEPDNEHAAAGAQALLLRATAMADDAEDEALATVLGYAARLAPARGRAATSIAEGIAKLSKHSHAGAEAAFRAARQLDPTDRVAMLGQQVAKSRLLASFEAGPVDVSALDETTAESLAALRRDDPDRPEPLAALAELLEAARAKADAGDTKAAARMLSLAIIVATPDADLRKPLEQGHRLLARRRPVEAARAFQSAAQSAPHDELVRTAVAIAERARLERMIGAIIDGTDRRVLSSLEQRLGEDDGEKIEKEILEAAEREAEDGRTARAVRLLDALNRFVEAEDVRAATSAGNRLLSKERYDEAETEYQRAQRSGPSNVAKAGERIAFSRKVAAMFQGVAALTNLSDLERGAAATKTLLSIDPFDKDGIAAVEAALDRAEAVANDRPEMIRALTAAAVAVDGESELAAALDHLGAGRDEEASAAFAEAERTLVPEEDEIDSSLKKLLAHQRTVAARGRKIAEMVGMAQSRVEAAER